MACSSDRAEVPPLGRGLRVLDRLVGEHGGEAPPLVVRLGLQRHRLRRPPAEVVDGRIVRDLEQPARELPPGIVGVEPPERLDEDLLRQVLGGPRVLDHAQHQAVDGALEPRHQLAEGVLRAPEGARDQLGVGHLIPPQIRLPARGLRLPERPDSAKLPPSSTSSTSLEEPDANRTHRPPRPAPWSPCRPPPARSPGSPCPTRPRSRARAWSLNGLALRTKFFIKVYVGGLYLPQKEKAAAKVLAEDAPRRHGDALPLQRQQGADVRRLEGGAGGERPQGLGRGQEELHHPLRLDGADPEGATS